ncbi:unnamed protein product [Discosporangium mesarthrocarpum]
MCTHVNVCLRVHGWGCMRSYLWVCNMIRVCMWLCMWACMWVCMWVCMRACMWVCACGYACGCVHAWVYKKRSLCTLRNTHPRGTTMTTKMHHAYQSFLHGEPPMRGGLRATLLRQAGVTESDMRAAVDSLVEDSHRFVGVSVPKLQAKVVVT